MTNCAMLVCSFYLKKRFSRGDEKLCLLNRGISIGDEESEYEFVDIFDALTLFCERNSTFSDNIKAKKCSR